MNDTNNPYQPPKASLETGLAESVAFENPHKLGLQILGVTISSIVIFFVGGWLLIPAGLLAFADAWKAGIYKNKEKGGFLNISPMAWGIVIHLLFIIGFPLYVIMRNKLKTKSGNTILYVLTIISGIVPLLSFIALVVFSVLGAQ